MIAQTTYTPKRPARSWGEVQARIGKNMGSTHLAKFGQDRAAARLGVSRRAYDSAAHNRLAGDWSALGTSADSEINLALRTLRARSRDLIRNNDYAKWAVTLVKNNVIGTGIGLQAQVRTASGTLNRAVNDQIEDVVSQWADADQCDPAGKLHFADLERMLIGSLVENGEVLCRIIRRPFGKGAIPFALELIESDRLMDQWSVAHSPNGNQIRMGVEFDEWRRPVAYWLYPTHPGDYQFTSFVASKFIRVPAEDMIHLYLPDRVDQTRGVPWMHTGIKRVQHMGGYEDAELVAARASAAVCGFITTQDPLVPDGESTGTAGSVQNVMDFEPGTWRQLQPGQTFEGFNPSRPNQAMEPFMRLMLRGFCAGIGLSYASVSKDYSQSNYSASRLALLDDRDMWRMLQGWFIRNFRQRVYRELLDAAALAGVLKIPGYFANTRKFQMVRFKPRGWAWIDPSKEVAAYKEAVRCGFMTVADVIDITSEHSDYEDTLLRRKDEITMEEAAGIVWDTNPNAVDSKGKDQGAGQADPADAEPEKADA